MCKNKIENEVTSYPLYNEERIELYGSCRNVREGMNFDLIPTDEQKCIFILSNKDITVTKSLAKFVFIIQRKETLICQ